MSGQEQAARQNNDLQTRMYDETVARSQPYTDVGARAITSLGTRVLDGGDLSGGVNMADWQQDPSYQFRLQQGQQALERGAAARGNLYSPAASKALMDFGQGLASNEYGTIYARREAEQNNLYSRLAGLAQGGAQSGQFQTAAGQNMANNIGQTNMSLADARTAGRLGAQQQGYSMFNTLLGAGATLAGSRF